MTRCTRNKVNLKSSAYNQTGQNYFEQLTAYNSMSSHLRRILLAKSVVDTRNKNYSFKKNQRCKVQRDGDKRAYLRPEVTDDVIDKLAYDTRHHPMDILRMDLNAKHLNCCNYNLDYQRSEIYSDRMCYEENDRMSHRQQLTSRNRGTISPMTTRSLKRKRFTPNFFCEKELKSTDPRTSACYSQQRKCRYEKDPFLIPCATTALDSSILKSGSRFPLQETKNCRSISPNASQYYDFDDKFVKQRASKQPVSQKQEEKRYVKFVYDITKEIMQRGLYTDKELQDVFKKHIDQYKGILNMNKMLYEIYQLKISLNVADDSDTDDELEDLIHAQKLLSVSEIRPPTPPKVLNDNKVMEKLESYQKMMSERPSSAVAKSVTLVDANPEILVTERDVLMSLVEVGIDPKQVQHICKNLRDKSKDTDLTETVNAQVSYPLYSEAENLEEPRDNERRISPEIETVESVRDSVADNSVVPETESAERKVSTSTSNHVSTEDETVDTNEKTESPITSEDDKVES